MRGLRGNTPCGRHGLLQLPYPDGGGIGFLSILRETRGSHGGMLQALRSCFRQRILLPSLRIQKRLIMSRQQTSLGYGLLLFGFALIFIGFFLLVPADARNDTFWLNLAVVCAVYLVFSMTELGIIGVEFDYDREITGLGTRLFFMRFYAIVALAIMVVCLWLDVSFRYQLFFQLTAVSLVLGGLYFSGLSVRQEQVVQEEQKANRMGLEEMKALVGEIERQLMGEDRDHSSNRRRMEEIRDRIRYLSPMNHREAQEAEREILGLLEKIRAALAHGRAADPEMADLWIRCEEWIKIRKNMYHQ